MEPGQPGDIIPGRAHMMPMGTNSTALRFAGKPSRW
jgi:hypothetical protein